MRAKNQSNSGGAHPFAAAPRCRSAHLALGVALSLAIPTAPAFAVHGQPMLQRVERSQAPMQRAATTSQGRHGFNSTPEFGGTRRGVGQTSDAVPKPNPIPPSIPGGSPGPTRGNVTGNPGFISNPFGPPGLETGEARSPR